MTKRLLDIAKFETKINRLEKELASMKEIIGIELADNYVNSRRDANYDVYIIELVSFINNRSNLNTRYKIMRNGDYCIPISKYLGSDYKRLLRGAIRKNVLFDGNIGYKTVRFGDLSVKADVFTPKQIEILKTYVEYVSKLEEL